MIKRILQLMVLILIVSMCISCEDKDKKSNYELDFSRDIIGRECKVFLELVSSKECDCTWNCNEGNFSNTNEYLATWTAPNENGEFEVECLVDGNIVAEKTIEVYGVVYDDFTTDVHFQDEWENRYSGVELIDGELNMWPTSSSYYGIVERELFHTLDPGYFVSCDIGNSENIDTSEFYGLNLGVNDTGSIIASNYWVVLGDIDTSYDNWAILVFLYAYPNVGWYLLEENSIGNSNSVKLNGQTNHIEFTMNSDKGIELKINGNTLLISDEIADLENEFNMVFSVGLEGVEGRTSDPEIFMDNVIVEETNRNRGAAEINDPRSEIDKVIHERALEKIDVSNLRSIREILQDRY